MIALRYYFKTEVSLYQYIILFQPTDICRLTVQNRASGSWTVWLRGFVDIEYTDSTIIIGLIYTICEYFHILNRITNDFPLFDVIVRVL